MTSIIVKTDRNFLKGKLKMEENNTLPPADFNQMTSDHYKNLTKSEKRIANFFRKNQNEVAFFSASQVADRLQISEATVVRFARTMGYASYPAMRATFQESFRHRITHSSRIRSRLNDMRETGDIFERLTVTEIDYLTQALETVSREELDKAVNLIQKRQRIFVFGTGPSITLVDLMEIRLRRFGKDIFPLRSAGREVLESLIAIGPNDLLFVICFFDFNPALKLVLDYANEVGCPVIMLTDTLDSIIGDKADVVLAAKRGPVSEFHSLVVPMTIINTLLLSVANQQQETIMPILDKLDTLREQLKVLNAQDK
jgi:DNA-binding MurR/RpiR family transcriptional regulator